ncbi:hypothetical protein Tco_1223156, partial [Tanacetum coccineum]
KRIEREQAANLAVQKEQEEQAAQSFTLEYLENSSNAITPEEPDKDLVPIPSESEGIFDIMCDVPFCDKNHLDVETDLMESLLNRDTSIVYSPKIDSLLEEFAGELAPINPIPPGIHEADFDPEKYISLIEQLLYDDYASSDDDTFYSEDIDYVEASPPNSELVSLEEVKNFVTEDGEINTDILLKIKDDILHDKLLNINLLIAKIKALNDNPTPDCVLKSPSPFPIPIEDSDSFFEKSNTSLSYSDNSLPEFETFSYHTEETSSGSTTTHADNSLPDYFDPEGGEIDTSPNADNDHYLPFTFVIRIFLPYLTYPKDSSLLLSSGNEDTIFDPGIFAYIFYSYKPVLSHRSGTFICFNVYLNILNESMMDICSSTCFPMDQ